jgi:hypothetical protein
VRRKTIPSPNLYRLLLAAFQHPNICKNSFATAPLHQYRLEISRQSAIINLQITINNDSRSDATVKVVTQIYALDANGNQKGKSVASFAPLKTQIMAGERNTVKSSITLKNPKLWGPPPTQTPNRYVAITKLWQNDKPIDQYETRFGIRSLLFDPKSGVFINEECIKIKSANQHHDLGHLGIAFNLRAAERQLELLREMGCNAIRMSHNPPAPELIELTDRICTAPQYPAFHIKFPEKVVLGSKTASAVSSRGVYLFPVSAGMSAPVRDGIILANLRHITHQAARIPGSSTWPDRIGQITPVHVFTSGDEAELYLIGKSLGKKNKGEFEYRLRWDDVIYQPGESKVVAYKDGKKWADCSASAQSH